MGYCGLKSLMEDEMAENGKLKLLAIVGPTASGKTAIAIQLARRLGGEVVSCDSMQVYRRMDVGTAKPNAEERAAAVHHLIDIVDPCTPFSCADYVEHAQRAIAEISADGKLPILCGGTGLYLDRLLCGGMEETTSDAALRTTSPPSSSAARARSSARRRDCPKCSPAAAGTFLPRSLSI